MPTMPMPSRWIAISILFFLSASALIADDARPIGALRLEAFLEAHNAGDREALARFAEAHFRPSEPGGRSPEERLGTMQRIAWLTGGLLLHRVEEVADEKVVALAQQKRDDAWVRLTLELEAEPPHRIAGFGLALTPPPADLAAEAGHLSEKQVVAALEADVEKLVADDEFSGTVLLARGEQVLFAGAYGKAERRFDVDNTLDTKLNLGSANKMFTAVAIGQLVDRGKLSFDSRLIDVVPDYPDHEIAEKKTPVTQWTARQISAPVGRSRISRLPRKDRRSPGSEAGIRQCWLVRHWSGQALLVHFARRPTDCSTWRR